MINAIVKALEGRFDADGHATVTMKNNNNTEVSIQRIDGFPMGDDFYEVAWGFNGSYNKFCDTLEEVADLLLHFDEYEAKRAKEAKRLLDDIMKLQMMEEGTIKATDEEISELRSWVSDWSKDFYHIRYRGHCERKGWF